jgi:hypothetical protein
MSIVKLIPAVPAVTEVKVITPEVPEQVQITLTRDQALRLRAIIGRTTNETLPGSYALYSGIAKAIYGKEHLTRSEEGYDVKRVEQTGFRVIDLVKYD